MTLPLPAPQFPHLDRAEEEKDCAAGWGPAPRGLGPTANRRDTGDSEDPKAAASGLPQPESAGRDSEGEWGKVSTTPFSPLAEGSLEIGHPQESPEVAQGDGEWDYK